ncbi:MAG: hypothetical protein GXO65_01420 [Euryarchaeota archaeon]|nr:hypothetical protein [Euryarchaeota archaeon]
MGEIVVKIPGEVDSKFMSELEKDIKAVVRLKMARRMLMEEWDQRFAKSKLTEDECLSLGKAANKAALKRWKEEKWL